MVENSAHLHLMVNHLPVLGFLFSWGLLLLGFLMRSSDVWRAGFLGMVFSAIFGVIAFFTGEGAEEIVEGLPTVAKGFLEQHESVAKTAMYVGVGAGIVSLVAFLHSLRRPEALRAWGVLGLLVGLVSSGVFGYTAFLGGKVNHPEIRSSGIGSVGEEGEHRGREEH